LALPEGGSAGIISVIAAPLSSVVTMSLWGLSERRARGKIPHKDEYIVGAHAVSVLGGQRRHITTTSIQRELYSALQESGSNVTPDQFLADIYAQMPSVLVNRRKEEMERAKYPETYTELLTPKALPKMVEVARILQPAA